MNTHFQTHSVEGQMGAVSALVVAGMHRSGTSALARVFSLLGAELPKSLMAPAVDNPKGFWESAAIAALNDEVLDHLDASWDDVLTFVARRTSLRDQSGFVMRASDLLKSEFSQERMIVLKEPRMCLLLDLWLEALGRCNFSPCVVIPVRDPLEVSASLSARDGQSRGRGLLLWLAHFLAAESSSRGVPRVFVSYDDLLQDWRRVVQRVEATIGAQFVAWTPSAERDIDEFIDVSMRHFVSPSSLIGSRSDVSPWVKKAYAWGLAAAKGQELNSTELDEIAQAFKEQLKVFAPIIADQKALSRSARKRAEALESQVLSLEANASETRNALVAAKHELAELQTNARQEEARLRGRLENCLQRISELETEVFALTSDVRDREARIVALEAELQSAVALLSRREMQAQLLQDDLTAARENVQAWTGAHAEIAENSRQLASQLAASADKVGELLAECASLKGFVEAAQKESYALSVALGAQRREHHATVQVLRDDISKKDSHIAWLDEQLAKNLEVAALNKRQELRIVELAAQLSERANAVDEAVNAAAKLTTANDELIQRQHTLEATLSNQHEHVAGLEEALQRLTERLQSMADGRAQAEQLAIQQADFIRRIRPVSAAVRRALWRNEMLRPISYCLDWARLSGRRGPFWASRLIRDALTLRSTSAFDVAHYLNRYWDVAASGVDPVVHYLAIGAQEGRDPSVSFSSRWYAARYRDVAEAEINPLVHYVRYGRGEGRLTSEPRETPAQTAANFGQLTPTFVDPYSIRPDDSVHPEAVRGAAFLERFRLLSAEPEWASAVAVINKSLSQPTAPDVSIIVPVYGQLAHTLNCLDALANHGSKHIFEVIVVDDQSPDQSRLWLERLKGIRLINREHNGGFIEVCNEGARLARGRWLVFLNNDTRVVEGWLDALIDHFAVHKRTGLVGSKLFYPNGTLQEAGGILWRDGSAWNYGRGDDPNKPEYCYARQVDYCSGASIALPRALWEELSGFDRHYSPAYCEDSDLALRVRYVAGREVWYQPLSRVIHYEGVTAGRDTNQGVKAYQINNQRKLFARWKDKLETHRNNGEEPSRERDRGVSKRALVIDPSTPTPDQDAGSNTVVNTCRVLQLLGYKVTFIPEDNMLFQRKYTEQLQQRGFECSYAPYDSSLDDHLRRRGAEYDVAIVFRGAVASKHLEVIRRHAPQAPIIFNNMDIHFLRLQRQADVEQRSDLRVAAAEMRKKELYVVNAADCTVTPSDQELRILSAEAPRARVMVFPYMFDVVGTKTPFQQRSDILFLGGYTHAPNVDAVKFFVREVWPLVRVKLPGVRFWAAGANPPDEIRALACDDVVVTGRVEDLAPLFDRCRVFVAPLRYGAGLKGKVATSMAHGLPCVVTSIAAEGMSLEQGRHVLIEDVPLSFADAVCRLYSDPVLWERLQREALEFAANSYSVDGAGVTAMKDVLRVAHAVHAARDVNRSS